jgi:hypothetical protein
MKSLIAGLLAVFAAVFALAGCVAVPYEPAPAGYYYGPPPPAVSFSYSYRDGGYRHRHW